MPMLSCPGCGAEVSHGGGRCAECGRAVADGPVWRVVFKTPEGLRKHYDRYMVHSGLVVPRSQPVERDSLVRLLLVLPDGRGKVWLTGKVVATLEQPSGSKAPYAVKLDLLDLNTEKKELLRPIARSIAPAGASRGESREEPASADGATPAANHPAPPDASRRASERAPDSDELDALVDGLIERCEQPPPADPPVSAAEPGPREAPPTRESLPEELAQELTDFTLQFVRAVTKSSYYTAEHQEAGKAKLGIYTAFRTLVADRPEVTFYARKVGERYCILVYGIFQEPTDLAQAMLRGTSEIYVPKLSHYFESNGLLSISFKPALTEDEFHDFVDLLAGPSGTAPGSTNTIVHRLAQNRIHNISVVVVEDRIGGRGLSWRVEMALTRLKKDLSVIPLYEHLSEEELRQIRLQVFRDVLRPLREVGLIRELLENCDRIIEAVEEFSEDQLAQIEAQVLASVPEASLPALLEGLAEDIAEAKRESDKETERLLRLTRRVASQLRPEQAKSLEDAFRTLVDEEVLGLEELPAFLQRKFRVEQDAAAFLKLEERILARLDRESNIDTYQVLLGFLESIFAELLARADPSPTLAIVDRVSEHRIADPPFADRPILAAMWLEELIYSSLAEEFVRELSHADKLKRESLLELCRRLGDETVPILFRALSGCENVSTRQAIVEVLASLKYASRAFLRREFLGQDLPADYLLELLRLLGRVGGEDCMDLLAPALDHADAQVRIEALGAASTLDPTDGDERIIAALSDADPKVRETALKTLFDRRSTAPAFFAFCGRILGEPDESNQEMARRICSRLTAYGPGAHRETCVALLRSALGDTGRESGGWWSSLKRSVTTESEPVFVKVAVCQALGRLGAVEASEALEDLSQHPNPALKRAAQHALECIRNAKPPPPS
jgi:HEAT repeat protein